MSVLSHHAATATRARDLRRVAALGASFALVLAIAGPPAVTAAATRPLAHRSAAKITKVHVGHLSKLTAGAREGANPETGPRESEEVAVRAPGSQQAKRVPAAHVPVPAGLSVTGAAGARGFDGQTHLQQRTAGTGIYANTNFSTEPPDMALCVGNGFVVQGVNASLRVYSTNGAPLTDPTALNQLYGAAPAVNRHAGVAEPFGDFIGDVKCYYDADTNRFFVTSFRLPLDAVTGGFPEDESHVVVAVSATGDPTGAWNVYDLDTTDGDGSLAGHPNCPCVADQPLIGADHYGFYISTNEYSLVPFGAFFNGAQVYAFNKAQLAAGAGGSLSGVHFGDIGLAEGQAYTIQPATTPPGGAYDLSNGGTAYALSALDFNATLDNRIAVWALTGTSTLGTTNAVSPSVQVLASESYGQPPDAEQKDGPTPLRDLEAQGLEGVKSVEHLELLAANDDRMEEVKYARGVLWSNLNTVVKNANGNVNAGIAWFAVTPHIGANGVEASITNQGYVAVNRANALYGAIAANNHGDAAMGFTLSGTGYYPSAAWVSLGANGATSDVHVAAAGARPEDGFTGYVVEGGSGTSRWGDYHAATADAAGNLWMSVEYIPNAPRSLFANWGTHVMVVTP